MTETILLTDDEVVAVAAVAGTPWPLGLSTVPASTEILRSAALRGVRSLGVRGLLTANAGKPPALADAVASAITPFLHAPTRIGAYIAPAANPQSLAGAAITAVADDDGWWTDATTSDGVHAIRRAGAEGARDAVAQFADAVHEGALLPAAVDSSAYVCVIRWGTGEDDFQVIPARGSGGWDRGRLDTVFAGAAG
jgi:hypothetical protein